jgi:hypothetical protein
MIGQATTVSTLFSCARDHHRKAHLVQECQIALGNRSVTRAAWLDRGWQRDAAAASRRKRGQGASRPEFHQLVEMAVVVRDLETVDPGARKDEEIGKHSDPLRFRINDLG